MIFDEILASLGEGGESGEVLRQYSVIDEAKRGEFAPAREAKANSSPRFAPNSPSPKPSPIQEIRPIRPIRPNEADEIISLVNLCGAHYGFTEQEFTEAVTAALCDHEAALTCFRILAEEFRAAVENSDRTTLANPECSYQSGREQ